VDQVTHDLGPHRLLGVIERDGDLVLCLAVHRQSAATRLIEVLLPGRVPGPKARRYLRQARATVGVRHPALPATFECGGLPPRGAFVVREPTGGEPGHIWLSRVGHQAEQPAAAMVGTIADACAALARNGVVHGGLSPGNLRLLPHPEAPELFALKLIGAGEALARPSTDAALAPYRAPELWRTGAAPDPRSDIYALGCLFFQLLTGRPPFAGAGERQGAAHLEATPPIDALAPEISAELRRLLGRMLAKLPHQRHRSMDEIVTALELILGRHRSRFGELLRAPPGGTIVPAREDVSPDLTPLASALSQGEADAWLAGAATTMGRLGASVRAAAARRLLSLLRPRPASPSLATTVLVAEDDDDTRQAVVELLQDNGYRVIAARHGREALEYLQKGPPAQCVVMDLWMPEMDGWTLVDRMKQGRLPAVPTIVMTAAEPHWGYPAPVVVRKPFDVRELLGLVRSVATSPAP
jgi:CheY-like chemotaxis protein